MRPSTLILKVSDQLYEALNPDSKSQHPKGAMVLPQVPNRWSIVRRDPQGYGTDYLMVESDSLYPKGLTPERAVCIPIQSEKLNKGDAPYRYLGRQE